ncbi:hypothetical protein AB836_00040 [Rickettsiales bacterium (ex Bugula neritina AB1)]|nr:hypothetical protein AB836_00040 [Rickettsiales bacterium (ex Bugula neritina AB1)]
MNILHMFFFISIVLFLTFIHELGHLITARYVGVDVKEFAVGFGPNIFQSEDKHKTVWSLNLIPLGGYVSFSDNHNNISEIDAMLLTSPIKRIIYAMGGPLFNILFFFVGIIGLTYFVGIDVYKYKAEQNIYYFTKDGFVIHKYKDKDVTFDGHRFVNEQNFKKLKEERYFLRGFNNNIFYSWYLFKKNIVGIYNLISKRSFNNVKSFISINKIISKSIDSQSNKKAIFLLLLKFLINLSLSLGLFNLIPFVPLDGFWVLFSVFDIFLSFGKMSQKNKRVLLIILNILTIIGMIILSIPLINEIIIEILCLFNIV